MTSTAAHSSFLFPFSPVLQVFTDAEALFGRLGNERGRAIAMNNLGSVLLRDNALDAATAKFEASIASARQQLQTVLNQGVPAVVVGGGTDLRRGSDASDPEQAQKRHAKQVRRFKRQLADRLGNLASLCVEKKDLPKAETLVTEALQLDREVRSQAACSQKRPFRAPSIFDSVILLLCSLHPTRRCTCAAWCSAWACADRR